MRCAILVAAFVCGWGLVGCSGSADSAKGQAAAQQAGTANAKSGGASAAKPIAIPANAPPEKIVSLFLDALRGGDQATTAALLTKKALTETSQRNLSVCPQATPHMQYQIKQAEVLADNPNGAHVNVLWTEQYTDGNVSYEVVWVLRRQTEGWRVAGMAIELVPGQGLAFLNFEDPDDMIRKQEEAMAALNPPAAETAALPPQEFGISPAQQGTSSGAAPVNPGIGTAPQTPGLANQPGSGDPPGSEFRSSSEAFPLPAGNSGIER